MEWLNKIFDWILQFVPRFTILLPSEEGIRVTCIPFIYKWCTTIKFGWYCHWPLFQDLITINIKPQILLVELSREDKETQSTVSLWAVQYWIQNPYKAIFEVEDFDERLASQSAKSIGSAISKGYDVDLDKIASEIRDGMKGFGVYIQEVYPLQFVRANAYKIFLDSLNEKVGRVIG